MSVVQDRDVAAIARISAVPTVLRLIESVTGMRLSLVARVTNDVWKACAVLDNMSFGLNVGGLLEVATTLCSEVRDSRRPIIIDHASVDPDYRDHDCPKMYGFESYISVPIFARDGSYFGNVCALDSRPLPLKSGPSLAMMQLYAELIGLQLQAEEEHESMRSALLDAHQTAELREQFIAVLGHDIRTPLQVISSGADLVLTRDRLAPGDRSVIARMQGSAKRIARLVDDLLDFARGRLGRGIPLDENEERDIDAVFAQVVGEAQATYPERVIRFQPSGCRAFRCDRGRLAQLLSNLLMNALQHSPASSPVDIVTSYDDAALTLRVNNQGAPIAEEVLARLFQPYTRGADANPRDGLGLGLYIAAEIVKSHSGGISVRSSLADGTTFEAILPLRASLAAS